jgi:hypothetical protein
MVLPQEWISFLLFFLCIMLRLSAIALGVINLTILDFMMIFVGFLFLFLVIVGIWVNLRAPRLIP